MTTDSSSTEALQAALPGEHSAIYVLGALGGRTSATSSRVFAGPFLGWAVAGRATANDTTNTPTNFGRTDITQPRGGGPI